MNKNLNSRGIPKATEVGPIKNPKDLEKIKQYLKGKQNRRDYTMFVIGINLGLRAGDLLELKLKDLYTGSSISDAVIIREQKTRKMRELALNTSAKEAIQYYVDGLSAFDPEDYLFCSQKGGHLTVQAAHKIIKGLLRDLNIKGNFGTHSLRKTWAYHIYTNNVKTNPMILPTLQKMLNHSNQATTLRYLGISKEVIIDVYNSVNL